MMQCNSNNTKKGVMTCSVHFPGGGRNQIKPTSVKKNVPYFQQDFKSSPRRGFPNHPLL